MTVAGGRHTLVSVAADAVRLSLIAGIRAGIAPLSDDAQEPW